jgi:CheY-like chemotaxis protein
VDVVAVASGDLALAAAAEVRPALVITDVMMPRLRGDELCRRIKADPALAATPVVLLSAVARADLPDVGAEAYLGKPFDLDDVVALVHRYAGWPAAT